MSAVVNKITGVVGPATLAEGEAPSASCVISFEKLRHPRLDRSQLGQQFKVPIIVNA